MCKRRVVKLDVTSDEPRSWRGKTREGNDKIICASNFQFAADSSVRDS